jgi:hypothetical protein
MHVHHVKQVDTMAALEHLYVHHVEQVDILTAPEHLDVKMPLLDRTLASVRQILSYVNAALSLLHPVTHLVHDVLPHSLWV